LLNVNHNKHSPLIIGADFNLEFVNGLTQCHAFNNFLASANLCSCDVTHDTTHTFVCESRNAQSMIDHFLVSSCLVDKVDLCCTVDSGLNFSDHVPLGLHCNSLPISASQVPLRKPRRYRWDKADFVSYYYASDFYLSHIDMSVVSELCHCSVGCHCDNRKHIDTVFQHIVKALHATARDHCPITTGTFFKPYWNEEMAELK